MLQIIHYNNIHRNTKVVLQCLTFLTAVFVFLENKSFSTRTDVTADSVHTFILASTIVVLTFVLIFIYLKEKQINREVS